MEITDVRIKKAKNPGKRLAIASVTFDDEFVVHDIKIIDGDSGMFISMPSTKSMDGSFRDIAHPINTAMRDRLERAVLSAYEVFLAKEEATEIE